MSSKVDRILSWSRGRKKGPFAVHLDMTNRCNLNCKFCWQRAAERKEEINYSDELSLERLLTLVSEAKDLNVNKWLISGGGEPLLRTEACLQVMEEIKSKGMEGDIITNGTFLEPDHLHRLIAAGWERIRFSVNGPTSEVHDFLVGSKGAFESTVTTIKRLRDLKRSKGVKKPEIGFNTVINSANYDRLPEMVELLAELGGDVFNVQTVILYSDKEEKWTLDGSQQQQLQSVIKEAIDLADSYAIEHNLHDYRDEELIEKSNIEDGLSQVISRSRSSFYRLLATVNQYFGAFCYEPWYLVTIRADGTVGSCRLFRDEGESLHEKRLKEIWWGDYFQRNRQQLLAGKPLPYCSKCGTNEYLENLRLRKQLVRRSFRDKVGF